MHMLGSRRLLRGGALGAQEAELAPAQGAEASGATGGAAQVAEPRAELRPEAAAPRHAAQGAGDPGGAGRR